VQGLNRRWLALDRGARIALAGIMTLAAAGIGVRAWFMISYPTAFMGFPDSGIYSLVAARNIFSDAQRPAGYPFFLRLVHHLSDSLPFTIAVQHALGIATGLLLYKAVRRSGAPPWLGLLPAAVVFFNGIGLFLEHSLLGDPLLAFLQAVAVYAAVCALYDRRLRWALLAGIALGFAFWVKTVALSSIVLIPLVLACAAQGRMRRRLLCALTVASVAVAMIGAYVGFQYYFTGYLGYERQSAWNLYGRVATFVNCSEFTPPSGTSFLCPSEPVSQRKSQPYYQYALVAPPVARFGPLEIAPLSANAVLSRFSVAAIEHEPIAYAAAIARGLGRYVLPRAGEGYTPQTIIEELVEPVRSRSVQSYTAHLYPHSKSYDPSGSVAPLRAYESDTRVQGPLLILLLAAAIVGTPFLRSRIRWASLLFTFTALLSITFAVAGNGYDARYAYPTFGPLAAGAALGAWGIGSFFARSIRRRRAAADDRGRSTISEASPAASPAPARGGRRGFGTAGSSPP
jgi:hypothetical protein